MTDDNDDLFDDTDDDGPSIIIIGTSTDVDEPEPPAWHAGIPEDASITVTVNSVLAEAVRDGIAPHDSSSLHTFSSSGEKTLSAREAATLIVNLHQSGQFQSVVLSVRPQAAGGVIIRLLANALWEQVYPEEHKLNVIQLIEDSHGADGLLRHLEFYSIGADDIAPYRKGLEHFSEDEDLFVPEEWLDEGGET